MAQVFEYLNIKGIKIILNVILLIGGCFTPLYILYHYQNKTLEMESIQYPALIILFIGSVLLTYLNNKYRKQSGNRKWLWLVLEVIGILGLGYSVFVLFLLFLYSDCCGF